MNLLEKEILFMVSRLRCLTESQFNKIYNYKRESKRKTLRKTLRRMCDDYILVKFPCNINYRGYKENSYLYYINGSCEYYEGDDLIKTLIGSDVAVRLKLANFEMVRFYRNINIGEHNYNLYIEYIDTFYRRKQVLFDIAFNDKIDLSKYETLKFDIQKTTIPFFMMPNVIVVTNNLKEYSNLEYVPKNVFFTDTSLQNLFKYL